MTQPTDIALGVPLIAAGMFLILGGVFALAWLLRHQFGYDEPEIPPVTQPQDTLIHPAVDVEPNYHRDDDTHVINPGIPGALPPQAVAVERFLDAVDDDTTETAVLTPVLREAFGDRPASEVLQRIVDKLRGPLCPNCGGPFGDCSCYSQNSSSDKGSDVTQVVDLCPLTTQDIQIPTEGETPFAEVAAKFRNPRQETQDLTVNLAEILERERVA